MQGQLALDVNTSRPRPGFGRPADCYANTLCCACTGTRADKAVDTSPRRVPQLAEWARARRKVGPRFRLVPAAPNSWEISRLRDDLSAPRNSLRRNLTARKSPATGHWPGSPKQQAAIVERDDLFVPSSYPQPTGTKDVLSGSSNTDDEWLRPLTNFGYP